MTSKLALEGGNPIRNRPLPEGWPGGWLIGEEEKKEVLEVIESKSLFRHYGPDLLRKVDQFEKEYAQYVGAKYALAVSSGTASLIVAMAGLGIGPGDEVILPSYNFIASAGAVIALKAVPVFTDIDDSLTMDPEDL
ncbi:aminotransferase class I/II-fold pyridoxal phosphate-dependent enzyme, partial [Candidatus Aerophobetes bacterium]|nr:aminotransferase class I/II-fold pyridoxal phosphate-dependent enzyme [Candidatus Aerophobetes bacterium]